MCLQTVQRQPPQPRPHGAGTPLLRPPLRPELRAHRRTREQDSQDEVQNQVYVPAFPPHFHRQVPEGHLPARGRDEPVDVPRLRLRGADDWRVPTRPFRLEEC